MVRRMLGAMALEPSARFAFFGVEPDLSFTRRVEVDGAWIFRTSEQRLNTLQSQLVHLVERLRFANIGHDFGLKQALCRPFEGSDAAVNEHQRQSDAKAELGLRVSGDARGADQL